MLTSMSAATMRGPNDAVADTSSPSSELTVAAERDGVVIDGDDSSKPKPRTGSSCARLDDRGGVGADRLTERGGRGVAVPSARALERSLRAGPSTRAPERSLRTGVTRGDSWRADAP